MRQDHVCVVDRKWSGFIKVKGEITYVVVNIYLQVVVYSLCCFAERVWKHMECMFPPLTSYQHSYALIFFHVLGPVEEICTATNRF